MDLDQSEYIKQLEARVEDLQEKYTMSSHVLNALIEKEHKLSFFVYEFSVRKTSQEWLCWSVAFDKCSLFKSFNSFAASLNVYDQYMLSSKRVSKDRRTHDWSHDCAWRVGIQKDAKGKMTIYRYENYTDGEYFYGDEYKSPVGKLFTRYLKRWSKK